MGVMTVMSVICENLMQFDSKLKRKRKKKMKKKIKQKLYTATEWFLTD